MELELDQAVVDTAQPGLSDSWRGSVAEDVRLGVLAACLRDGAFPVGAWAGLAGKLWLGLALGVTLMVGVTLGVGVGGPEGPGLGETGGLGLGLGLPPELGGQLPFANATAAKMP
jgi:hypothetical protein